MAREAKITAVEVERERRRWCTLPLMAVIVVVFVIGSAVVAVGALAWWRFSGNTTAYYPDIEEHFKYGSIGSEPESGLPYWIWQALPALFPEAFGGSDYQVFGFLYETDEKGDRRDLPIGVSTRRFKGVDLVWLNCAVCHTGTWASDADGSRHVVLGMPANNFNLYAFIQFLFTAAIDERLSADSLMNEIDMLGADLDWLDRLAYRFLVIPKVREKLLSLRQRLGWLLDLQPAWGPGRVDTFNPYKVIQFGMTPDDMIEEELIGVGDLPSIWLQGPREGMHLHWDGNNTSLQERNLSAAIGAGVTEKTVDHHAIERIAKWLKDLAPPSSPLAGAVDGDQIAQGREIYMERCAACHGYQGPQGYVFEGESLGTVEPIDEVATEPARLDSYTERLAELQTRFFAEDPEYHFVNFAKTDGYANLPLDGLWLRGPYLHNGSVPTLRDLLAAPDDRPPTFVRGDDVIDAENGGFVAKACVPGAGTPGANGAFCYDTAEIGNGNQGHLYGTDLSTTEKEALLGYLKTF